MYSFRITTGSLQAIRLLADERGESTAATVRVMLRYAQQNMPPHWTPNSA